MRKIKTKVLAVSLAAITCSSFTLVQNREEEIKGLSSRYAVVTIDCFLDLLKNLKELKVIIYLPDTKLEKGKEFNLSPISSSKDAINLENYYRLTPVSNNADLCGKQNKLTFENLEMIVYIDKNYADKLPSTVISKYEIKLESTKFKVEKTKLLTGDKLNVITDGSSVSYSQVEFKIE